jgi:hypothetical protein
MGLDINDVHFLIAAKKRGLELGDTLTLGRLKLMVFPREIAVALKRAGIPADRFATDQPQTGFAEPVFQTLGARAVHSMDFSDFEGAEVVHDLNQPLPDRLKQRYDTVYDGGTIEHVFNTPTALQSCMELVRLNGRVIIHTAANNWCGHGFYQFSPELFYNVFSEENGFEVERMILHIVGPYNQWYEVANPRDIQSRVELYNWAAPLLILVQARRKAIVPIFRTFPQQSDYVPRWKSEKQEPSSDGAKADPNADERPSGIPILNRVFRVMRTGYTLWRGNSLQNRKKFKPVRKWD